MFRTLIYPSSGACDCVDELPHRSSCSQFVVCWSFCCGWCLVVFVLQAEAQLCVELTQPIICPVDKGTVAGSRAYNVIKKCLPVNCYLEVLN